MNNATRSRLANMAVRLENDGDDSGVAAGIRALLAESEWQPIETAPKDGERVLISCGEGVVEAEFWAAGVRGNKGKAFFEAPYYGQDIATRFKRVTHWMPLPEPPK